MKRIVLSLVFALCAVFCGARTDVSDILSHLEKERIKISYKCTVKGDVPITFEGEVTAQEKYFFLKGNGMEIYCDGVKMYAIDPAQKEVIVQSIESLENFLMRNVGEVRKLEILSVSYSPKSDDLSIFTHPAFDDDWVITEL